MTKIFKSFSEETLEDALSIIRERFPPSAETVARKVLQNPLRRLDGDAGTIGYRDGRPVCMQSATLRLAYLGRRELVAMVGGLTCKVKKGCPLSVTLETIERAEKPRGGAELSLGNSCINATADMDMRKGGNAGPESCTCQRWRAIRLWDCAIYFLRRKVFKLGLPVWPDFSTLKSVSYFRTANGLNVSRAITVDPEFFDPLMARYLKTNRGLVLSRSAEEIDWMFGERIRDGRCVLLRACRNDEPVGYIILGSDEKARRWMMLDWFAVDNDKVALETLLKVAVGFLRKKTPAFMLETRGFPMFIQPLIVKYLPHLRRLGVNSFAYSWRDAARSPDAATMAESWFYGPYDGDLALE